MKPRLIACLFALGALASCEPAHQPDAPEFLSIDTTVESRGVAVPVTYVHPLAEGDETFPLVVIAHGHGGSRNESGAFRWVAEELAARGVASIRMDFPGCGDSSESFANNNLSNMLKDIEASRDYAVRQPNIDPDRVGLFGWSMGGRLAILAAEQDDTYKAIATWAPAAQDGASSMVNFLGGPDAYQAFKARAERDGSVPFTTRWGQDQELGYRFFTDMEQSAPLESVTAFEGPLLVLYGDRDDVVLPEVSDALVEAAVNSEVVVRYVIQGADHGLGVFSDEPHYTKEAVDTTVSFLATHL
ncbi:MAG: alpha/beta fold hydrolase [Woeseiaceae bacterium]|nr:alpha/beta fold hydrolase [Woeseiaceae bacterium]